MAWGKAEEKNAFQAMLNIVTLLPITRFTKQLDVTRSVASAFSYRNQMIKFKVAHRTTSHAFPLVSPPHVIPDVLWDWRALVS